ncbi:hypothetical protein [Psychrobacillus lasiicapitis]|uniref:Uncharacterized protein n=1 Tax=Psychrobacillus lasiicapitis TaxID=1636719 RepID=A0A544TAA2_9BACI|nr:hypothetical protein [Psychrobacillus lasiicapitis]TQR14369.1 hypothetical protein FG382_07890 [Psychrobacillus lasiicapitis]GGA31948.1 hypothetical protein GCM10011384_21880 [Psychrobacillus lasiicapitis]
MWNREGYTNTKSKSQKEVKQDARIINVIESCDVTLKDPHEIAFVVSKRRGFEEYKQVVRQTNNFNRKNYSLTPYSESLITSMFGGW